MNTALLFLLLQVYSIWPAPNTTIPTDDKRPPIIQSKMTDKEIQSLKDAEDKIAIAQAALAEAQSKRNSVEFGIIRAHKTKETEPDAWCGQIGYRGRIERIFVVFELGIVKCYPV